MKTTEEAAEMVLRAAGSSLKNYTMPATREAILAAVMEIQHDAMAEGNCGECVIRPTERKVPDVVEELRDTIRLFQHTKVTIAEAGIVICDVLLKHFEKGEQP